MKAPLHPKGSHESSPQGSARALPALAHRTVQAGSQDRAPQGTARAAVDRHDQFQPDLGSHNLEDLAEGKGDPLQNRAVEVGAGMAAARSDFYPIRLRTWVSRIWNCSTNGPISSPIRRFCPELGHGALF